MPQSIEPTRAQLLVLRFMFSFYRINDQLPTMDGIASHFGWASANAANLHAKALEARGLLERNTLKKYKFTDKGRSLALATSGALAP
jgi:SOS-response transcriptional repressor LexA